MELTTRRIDDAAPAFHPATASPRAVSATLLMRVLDEIDYGLMLVGSEGALHYANHMAMDALRGRSAAAPQACAEGDSCSRLPCATAPAPRSGASGHGALVLHQRALRARAGDDQVQLADALVDAQHGRRRLITLGKAQSELSLALVPMCGMAPDGSREPLCLLLLGKPQASDASLSLDFFSRTHRLTNAEAVVLRGLCRGQRPKELARELGVAISTVRTQIGSLRTKTKSKSIGDLMRRVAMLPPITHAMKGGGSS